MALANAVEQACDFNPELATVNVRQDVEDAVRDGRKDCLDAKGNLIYRYTVEQEKAERRRLMTDEDALKEVDR